MTITTVQLTKRYYGSLEPGRRQNLLEILDPHFVLELQEGLSAGRLHFVGIRQYFEDFLDFLYADVELELLPEEFIESGARAVVTGRMRGRAIRTGAAFDIPFVHVWLASGRHLSHARFFTDTAILKEAIRS
ncbi:MAG TPA: nuclear transport factor 2 family protein [Gemmatimonadales bacterium]|nr:nuclear transport factor 2 family protein [Gemmatimonadales bacterium]